MASLPDRGASVEAWLRSPALPVLVARAATRYGIAGDDVQDLVQETLIAVWRARPQVTIGAAWISRVAMNKAVDFIRRRTRVRACLQTIAWLAEPQCEEPDLERLLMARISELPLSVQQFYALHYKEGWSERETAARLDRCRASVRWLDYCLRRAVIRGRPPREPVKRVSDRPPLRRLLSTRGGCRNPSTPSSCRPSPLHSHSRVKGTVSKPASSSQSDSPLEQTLPST